MIELKHKTRGNSETSGKPRVYFTCHPDNFEHAFGILSEDILQFSNCSIWYDPAPGEPYDEEELEAILNEMQLVVIAVTSVFLHEENRARLVELPLALKNHIPVLPIMMEDRLGYEFSNTCAKIQVVRRYDPDRTATPYEEVLERFLRSVLVGDELAEKVRNAFDAYVFLSYRKKDRAHAQRLMRMIHGNKEFRDIAIWYDEFLVPGEGFNEAIKDAFEKSSLFAMAVTPHLGEKGNYVMRVEYKMAMERSAKTDDFAVVPVELYRDEDKKDGKDWRLDTQDLVRHDEFKYNVISDLKDEHSRADVNQTFIDALERIAKKKNDGSAQHRFFIGLAYLTGIDVEKDSVTALELLTSAAMDERPCPEATAKLADMYRNGDGVKADQEEAVRWQEMLSQQYLAEYEKNHDPDEHKGWGTLYFRALCKLSDMQKEINGKMDDAVGSVQKALAFCDALEEEVGIREQSRDKALILNRLGSLYREKSRYDDASDCYKKACRIYEKLAAEITTDRARRDLSIAYERLGDLCRDRKDLAGAEGYYNRTKAIREKLYHAALDGHARRDYSAVLTKLGNVRKSEKNYDEAMRFYEEALDLDLISANEMKTPQAWDDYGVSLTKTADIHKARGAYPQASEGYRNARDIFRKYMEKTDSRSYMDHYAGSCDKLASIMKRQERAGEAEQLYRESVDYRRQLYEASGTYKDAHNYAAALYNTALYLKDADMMKEAYDVWNGICTEHPEYAYYRDKAKKKLG